MIPIDTLERFHQINAPITFMNGNGSLFFSPGSYSTSPYVTSFFKVKDIDKNTGCLTLELLRAYPDICMKGCKADLFSICCTCELYRTSDCVTVDPRCFCGVQIHSIPIFDAIETCKVIKDEICCEIHLNEGKSSCQIYENRLSKDNTATITLNYINGTAPILTARLFLGRDNEHLSEVEISVEKYNTYSTTVENIRKIILIKPIEEAVNGKLEIELNTIQREIIRF